MKNIWDTITLYASYSKETRQESERKRVTIPLSNRDIKGIINARFGFEEARQYWKWLISLLIITPCILVAAWLLPDKSVAEVTAISIGGVLILASTIQHVRWLYIHGKKVNTNFTGMLEWWNKQGV